MRVPIDEPEGQRLEFKGRGALADARKIGAVVVAFLNSEGGDIYVGVREERDRAVAIEGIENIETEVRRLRDFLIDVIEPSPGPAELEISGSARPSSSVMRLRVAPGRHRPYALLGGGGSRSFWVRIGPRNRPMTREELAAAFSVLDAPVDPIRAARQRLIEERDEIQRTAGEWFWMAIQPVPEVEWDIQRPGLRSWLMDPETIGARPGSPTFQVPFEPELRQGRLISRAVDGGTVLKETVLCGDGGIRFRSVLEHLYRRQTGSELQLIHPDVLTGVPLSLFLLAKDLPWGRFDIAQLVVDLALFGVGRARAGLLPDRWRVPRPGTEVQVFTEQDDLTLPEPLCFPFDEVVDEPEHSLFRLLRPVYEAFGLREEAMPFSFDPATGLPLLTA